MLLSVVGEGAAISCGQIEAAAQSRARGLPLVGVSTPLLPASRLPRPGDGTSDGQDQRERFCPKLNLAFSCLLYAAAVISLLQRKSVPSTHMRCRMVASLRASATLARFRPRRLATSSPQRLSALNRVGRLRIALAASYRAVRTIASPALLIAPVMSVSPD